MQSLSRVVAMLPLIASAARPIRSSRKCQYREVAAAVLRINPRADLVQRCCYVGPAPDVPVACAAVRARPRESRNGPAIRLPYEAAAAAEGAS